MSKLDLKSFQKSKSPSMRDKRLPDRSSKGGKAVNITSSIAATAATTLNAERSAYKLKKVLLSVRDKPLLNAKTSTTVSTRVEFETPQKLGSGLLGSTGGTPITPCPPLSVTFPATASPSPLSTSGGTRRTKHHAKSVWSSKKPDGESSPSPAPAKFDWGPPPASASGQKQTPSLPFSLLPSIPPPGSDNKPPGLPFALR
jgi:nucleoporin NUP159